jgi:hypothetical protein
MMQRLRVVSRCLRVADGGAQRMRLRLMLMRMRLVVAGITMVSWRQ